MLLSIDPGPEISGWIITDNKPLPTIFDFGVSETTALVKYIQNDKYKCKQLAIEAIASYGMAVGASVFETCYKIGQIIQAFGGADQTDCYKIYRKSVKLAICQTVKAKDNNIRQAILDMYPATGGGKVPQKGTMKQPGPLYGISSHTWSALAVAITFNKMNI